MDESVDGVNKPNEWDKVPFKRRVGGVWPIVAAAGWFYYLPGYTMYGAKKVYRKPEPKLAKCGLPECKVMTAHRGGYCCPEHCREHHRRQREARKA